MSEFLLEVQDLRTWFPIRRGVFSRTIGHVKAVDGVTLSVAPGETLGLVGESGCGKTTLGRTLVGLERARAGRISFRGLDLTGAQAGERRALRRKLQMVFQDPFESLNPRMTAMDIVTEGEVQCGRLARRDCAAAARALMAEVGLDPNAIFRYPHEFSGGQRQRISVARALSVRPAFIICDEAVSALDVSIQAQIINLLMDLRDQHGLSYLFISHDLSVVRHISDRIAVMYLGRIVEQGPSKAVIDAPIHPYTRALVSAIPVPRRAKKERIVLEGDVPSPANPPPGCRFHTRCPFAIDACRQAEPRLEPRAGGAAPGHLAACIRKDAI
ncbi:MAG: ABC transporter ATP-binding protein [Kiritimatiellae bacterium]|nr:ABC transporter ATP-binding protein [Kiritimatiellia bacterium]